MQSITYLYNVSHDVPLGLNIAMYFFFTGLSAGSFVISTLGTVFGIEKYKPLSRVGVVMATWLLLLAPIYLIIDLEQPGRFHHLFFYFNLTSPLSWGTIALILYPINCIIYGWFLFRRDVDKRARGAADIQKDDRLAKIFGSIGIPLAIAVHGYTGFIFAVIQSRPLWHTSIMPIIFLMSAVVSGTALLILFLIIKERFFSVEKRISSERSALLGDIGRMLMWFIVVDVALIVLDFITLYYTTSGGYVSAYMLLWGEFQFTFLILENIIGMAIPFVLLAIPSLRKQPVVLVICSVLVLMGIAVMRYDFVLVGLLIPLSGAELARYSVQASEVLSSILLLAAFVVPVLYTFKLFPYESAAVDITYGKEEV